MHRLFVTLLATWGFVVLGAAGQEKEECKFDTIDYKKDLNLAEFSGLWNQIRVTNDAGCNGFSVVNISEAEKTFKIFEKGNKDKVEFDGTFTHDQGVFKIAFKGSNEQAVVLNPKLDYKATAILYSCKIENDKKVVSARHLSRAVVKLADAKKVVEDVNDVKGLTWDWTDKNCTTSTTTAAPDTSSASFAPPLSHVVTILLAVLVRSM